MATQRKATDLERLTQPGGKPLADDATIPVLTERLTLPSLELDISLPQPPPPVVAGPPTPLPPAAQQRPARPPAAPSAAAASAPPAEAGPVAEAAPSPGTPAIDWNAFETQLRDKLLAELQPKIAGEFERHMRDRLQPALDRALVLLMTELRNGVDAQLRESLQRLVSAEIARLRDQR